ncbi:Jonah 44E [Carabus blaptoides fortunei]
MDLQNKSGFDSRIISGQPAAKGQIPWHAGLRITKEFEIDICGVQLGVTKWDQDMTEKITSKDTQMHENYNTWLHNDIGLIKLPRKVAVSDTVKPIRLPSRGEASSILNFVELTTISNNDCANFHGAIIISSSICTVGNSEHSPCSGDSGGPLVPHQDGKDPTLVGVASFVHIAGCDSGKPSGYARVVEFLDWINGKTGIPIQD